MLHIRYYSSEDRAPQAGVESWSKDGHKEQDVHTTVKRCQEGEKKIWQTILAHEQIFDHFVTILPQTPNDQAGIIDAKISASEHHHVAF